MLENIGFHLDWLETWLAFHAANPDKVIFTHFRNLPNARALIRNVLRKHGYDGRVAPIPDLIEDDRRRFDGATDWTSVVSPGVVTKITAEVENRLSSYPMWDKVMR